MKLTPFLVLNGNAKDAIEFYKQALDAEVLTLFTYGNMPEQTPEEMHDLVAHANLKIGGANLMIADNGDPTSIPINIGNQVTICVTPNDVERAQVVFDKLKQGGQVNFPLEKTSFSPAYGNVTDKFGITFQIFTEEQDLLLKLWGD